MNELEPNDPNQVTYFAATHTRGKHTAFGIRARDRDKHMYVIGKSGMGKSTMLENMAIQDIQNGEGLAFIDPHGSTAEKLLDFVPKERVKDVLYLAPFDVDNPVGFNIMEDVGYDQRHKVVAGLMGTFERIWKDTWSARMQYILQNTLLALLEYPGSTIIDVNRMLINKAFRDDVIKHISDPIIASFWKEEFANFTDSYAREATPAIQNKIGQFISNPLIRNIVGQPVSSFDVREIMDSKKILIVNLSKGRMGETNAALLGSMLVIKIYLAALSRAEDPAAVQAKHPPFYFYVDEFQSVVNDAFANILSEARKYKLALIIAHQYIEQMEEEVRNAIFGNVGTTIMFRVGPIDAEFLKTVFEPTFYAEDMVNLGLGEIYLTLMIDGVGSQPFSAHTIPPIEEPLNTFRDDIIEHTKVTYGRRRESVEEAIHQMNDKWHDAAQNKHKKDSAAGQQRSQASSGGKKFTPAPRREAPKPTRSPAEVLRERKPEVKKEVKPQQSHPEPQSRPQPQSKPQPQKFHHEGTSSFATSSTHERSEPVDEKRPGGVNKTKSQPRPQSRPQQPEHKRKEENTQKNALQSAVEAATHGKEPKLPQPTPKPQLKPHAQQQQNSQQKPQQQKLQQQRPQIQQKPPKQEQKRADEGISPEELMRILNGNDK